MDDAFYRRFEDRFRGGRELILARLEVYAPLLAALAHLWPDGHGVDLGCGRGEWLECVSKAGLRATGVDANPAMTKGQRSADAVIVEGDALAFLSGLDDNSVVIVSAFHLVEHIPFDDVIAIATQAFRVLVPGGLILFETPNPDNLTVGSNSFYLDPTHRRPLPQALLEFVVEDAGFTTRSVWGLNGPDLESVGLLHVIRGASGDYAVIAQKSGPDTAMRALSPIFEQTIGTTLNALAQRFDAKTARERDRITNCTAELRTDREEIEANLASVLTSLQEIQAGQRSMQTELAETKAELASVFTSKSWTVTRPFRAVAHHLRRARANFGDSR